MKKRLILVLSTLLVLATRVDSFDFAANPGAEERKRLERHLAFDKEWNSYPFSDIFIVDEWADTVSPRKGN